MPYPAVPEVYFRTPLSESYSSTNFRYMLAVSFSIALSIIRDARLRPPRISRCDLLNQAAPARTPNSASFLSARHSRCEDQALRHPRNPALQGLGATLANQCLNPAFRDLSFGYLSTRPRHETTYSERSVNLSIGLNVRTDFRMAPNFRICSRR